MKYIKYIGIILMPILMINIVLIIMSYFNKYSIDLEISSIIVTIMSSFIGGYYIGNNSKSKAYLEGIKLSSIIVLLFIIIRILANKKLNIFRIIYYIIIIMLTTLGSILGINKKIKAK